MLRKYASLTVLIAMCSSTAFASKALELKTDTDIASYGVGLNIGGSLKAQGLPDLNIDAIVAGLTDAVSGSPKKVTDQQLKDAFTSVQKRERERSEKMAKENLIKGKTFLDENKKKQGVVTTDSGLQYKIIKAGKGRKPSSSDIVVTNYRGKLIDGTEFDSSYKRKAPVEFPVNRVIPGWTEALQLMPVGSTWELYIPAKLAYGEFSPTPDIPPNSTLIFDIELLDIKAAQEAKEAKK